MTKNIKTLFFSLFSWLISLGALTARAEDEVPEFPGVDLTIQSVFGIITGLVCWFSRVALILMVVFIVYYGLQFMFARGDPTKVTAAKKSFGWGLVGVLVILGTYTIIATIANGLDLDYSLLVPLDCTAY